MWERRDDYEHYTPNHDTEKRVCSDQTRMAAYRWSERSEQYFWHTLFSCVKTADDGAIHNTGLSFIGMLLVAYLSYI